MRRRDRPWCADTSCNNGCNTSLLAADDASVYRSCVGALMYHVSDRADAQFEVSILGLFWRAPTSGAMEALRVTRYLLGTQDAHVGVRGFHARDQQTGLARAILEGDLFLSVRSSSFFSFFSSFFSSFLLSFLLSFLFSFLFFSFSFSSFLFFSHSDSPQTQCTRSVH